MCVLLEAAGPAVAEVTELISKRAASPEWKQIDQADRLIAQAPQVDMPLHHLFTPQLYSRSICIPAGTIATTRIHLKEHPFVISAGVVLVWSDEGRWEQLQASHIGVTKAGTRRILYAVTDVIWHTFHVTNETDPDKLVEELTFDPVKLGHLDDLPREQLLSISNTAKDKKALL